MAIINHQCGTTILSDTRCNILKNATGIWAYFYTGTSLQIASELKLRKYKWHNDRIRKTKRAALKQLTGK